MAHLAPPIDIGIPTNQRLEIAEGLGRLWPIATCSISRPTLPLNAPGRCSLAHTMFMEQYTEL